MILEQSLQAKFLIPIAVSLGFGVLFATFITLLLVQCGYLILEDLHNLRARIRPPRDDRLSGNPGPVEEDTFS
jgi:hypothetical protein